MPAPPTTQIDLGNKVRLVAAFSDDSGAATDPTTVRFNVKSPDPGSIETSYTYGVDAAVVRESAGLYHFDLLLNKGGVWAVRWVGSGTLTTVTETTIPVKISRFVNPDPPPHTGLQVTLFTLTSSDQIVEVGSTLTLPTFLALYNAATTAATLSDDQGNPVQDISSTPLSFASTHSYTKNTFGAEIEITLNAASLIGAASATLQVSWGQLNYWGVGPAGQTGATFIQGLQDSALALTKTQVFTVDAGVDEKIYYATRTAYGDLQFIDTSTGFGVDISKVGDFSVTNAHGFQENYQLWETTNVGLSELTVQVS